MSLFGRMMRTALVSQRYYYPKMKYHPHLRVVICCLRFAGGYSAFCFGGFAEVFLERQAVIHDFLRGFNASDITEMPRLV